MSAAACCETRLGTIGRVGIPGLNRTAQLLRIWRATWAPAIETVLYVEPLASPGQPNDPGDLHRYAPTPAAATHSGYGRAYSWCGGVVLTGVISDAKERLSLAVHAVDRHGQPDHRLDEIGEGWTRDELGWLAFRSGIHDGAAAVELEPLRAAALNMAAQVSWLSGRRQTRRGWAAPAFPFSRPAEARVGRGQAHPILFCHFRCPQPQAPQRSAKRSSVHVPALSPSTVPAVIPVGKPG